MTLRDELIAIVDDLARVIDPDPARILDAVLAELRRKIEPLAVGSDGGYADAIADVLALLEDSHAQ